jgi:hypothetical protein
MMGSGQAPQAETVTRPKKWPMVSRLQTRAPITVPLPGGTLMPITKDAHLINGFAEFDPEDQEYWIYKRLGLGSTPLWSLGAGDPGGTYTSSQKIIYAVQNNTLFAMSETLPSSPNNLGTIPIIDAPPYYFTEGPQSATARYLIVTDSAIPQGLAGTFVVYVNNVATALTGTPPTQVGPGSVELDGTVYVMDTFGAIWGSDIDNPLNWNALNVIQADSEADSGMFLAKQLSYVIAFKQWSTQVFQDVGNPTGSPLAPVPESQIPLGMLDNSGFQSIDDTLFWITSNHDNSPQIARLDNLTPKIVSTPAVEKILANYYTLVNLIAQPPIGVVAHPVGLISWKFKWGGHRFYGLTIQQLNVTLVYDIDQDLWYYWTDPNGNFWPVYSIAYQASYVSATVSPNSFAGFRVAQHASNGNMYELDAASAIPTDLGVLYPVDIYTPNLQLGNRRGQLNALYFVADQTPGSFLQARYSDNDYQSWSNFRSVSLNQQKPALFREGTIRSRRAYHFRHMCNTDFRIKSSGLQMDVGVL